MLPEKISLEIVTPHRRVLTWEVKSVVLPGESGSFGVLPGHQPLLAALRPGRVKVRRSGGEETFSVAGGFVEVLPGRVNVLVTACERVGEIDLERARAARDRAGKRVRERGGDIDRERARRALERAQARIRAVEREAPE
jgi:F-type H+-transporting ATPase subunit epsilon